MRIINVVTIRSGVVDEVQSFGVYDEDEAGLRKIVAKAEALFTAKAKELGYDENRDGDMEDHLDNGYYQFESDESHEQASVCLTWTEITPHD